MSLLLTSAGRDNVVRRPGDGLCLYCNKVFKDPRALGGHLRAHRGQVLPRKSLNGTSRSGNSLNITRAAAEPLVATQSMSVMRGPGNHQNAASFSNGARLPIFSKGAAYEWVNDRKSPEKSVGNTENQFSVSANLSPGCDRAEICHFQSWSFQLSPPPCCTNPNTSLNHSFPSGSDAVFQFYSDASQSLGDGGQISENALPSIQYQDQGPYLEPRVGSNQQTLMRGSTNIGPFIPDQNPSLGRGESGGYNNNRVSHGGKKRYSGEGLPGPAMIKRPIMDCSLMIEAAEHQNNDVKELLLLKDVENPVCSMEKSFDANEEPETDLDLSLHL